MIDYISNNAIVESFNDYPIVYTIEDIQYRIRDLVRNNHDVESLGFFKRIVQEATLADDEYVSGYNLELIDGRSYDTPIVSQKTQEMLDNDRERMKEKVKQERNRRLALGFDYDFGDDRSIHTIGTTPEDMTGWDEVTKWAQSKLALNKTSDTKPISTETGYTSVTPLEWFSIIEGADAHRGPIWQSYFGIKDMDPIPSDYTDDSYWP